MPQRFDRQRSFSTSTTSLSRTNLTACDRSAIFLPTAFFHALQAIRSRLTMSDAPLQLAMIRWASSMDSPDDTKQSPIHVATHGSVPKRNTRARYQYIPRNLQHDYWEIRDKIVTWLME